MRDKNRKSKAVQRRAGHLRKAAMMVLAAILLFAACGAEEQSNSTQQNTEQDPKEEGDYVYVLEQVEEAASGHSSLEKSNFLVKGDCLYYMEDGIYRVPVAEKLDFGKSERVVSLEELPEEERYISAFTVDMDENLYYWTPSYQDGGVFPVLHKRAADGEEVYSVTGQEAVTTVRIPVMAVDGEGNLYLLSLGSLLRYSPEGSLTGKLQLKEMAKETDEPGGIGNYLMELPEGRILLFSSNSTNESFAVYEVLEGDTPQLRRIDALCDILSGTLRKQVSPGLDGLLLVRDRELCQYDFEDGSLDRVLNLEDSFINAASIKDVGGVVQVSREQMLILKNKADIGKEMELVLLTKTPADQVPEKETIVLASLFPSYALELTVAKFNQESDRYQVSIEKYGAVSYEEYEGAEIRMDAALISKDNAPDLLDMSDLDIVKYADAGALEDLYSYMGQGSRVKKEDYLSNLLEGYTFGGKLACIPKKFRFSAYFVVADGPLRETDNWNMENIMEITGQYPDAGLVQFYDGTIPYYYGVYLLEKYVDLNAGECSFDSESFLQLLEWLKQESAKGGDGEDQLLKSWFVGGYNQYQEGLIMQGEDAILRGYPSADGRDVFLGNVGEALGITANSGNKEGAWEFLEFYLLDGSVDEYLGALSFEFPTSISMLDQVEEAVMTPQYRTDADGEIWLDENGQPKETPRMSRKNDLEGYTVEYYALSQDAADALREKLEQMDFRPRSALEESVLSIVEEEAKPFFNGEKAAEEAAAVIQNRVSILLQENR